VIGVRLGLVGGFDVLLSAVDWERVSDTAARQTSMQQRNDRQRPRVVTHLCSAHRQHVLHSALCRCHVALHRGDQVVGACAVALVLGWVGWVRCE